MNTCRFAAATPKTPAGFIYRGERAGSLASTRFPALPTICESSPLLHQRSPACRRSVPVACRRRDRLRAYEAARNARSNGTPPAPVPLHILGGPFKLVRGGSAFAGASITAASPIDVSQEGNRATVFMRSNETRTSSNFIRRSGCNQCKQRRNRVSGVDRGVERPCAGGRAGNGTSVKRIPC